ncbi:MAG: hypothetical protein C0443_03520 [Comamonadaceae bacterium]|nr:hypothetical protein [Comamonadaceae bacterium]
MSTRLMRVLARGLLAAMLLAVLAPAVSRALASTRGAGDWVELCTPQGMRWVQWTAEGAETEPVGAADDLLHALDHCGHCALASERFAPLLPRLPVVPQAVGVWGLPLYQDATPHALDAPSPGARGPPLLS